MLHSSDRSSTLPALHVTTAKNDKKRCSMKTVKREEEWKRRRSYEE
jgi:hypothetical protein